MEITMNRRSDEHISINDSQTEYQQHNSLSNEIVENVDQISTNEKGCITTFYVKLKHVIFNKSLWWFKCHWSGKIVASTLQLLVLGDLVSDLFFLSKVIKFNVDWWVFSSVIILYLSLRFTLVFTITFENDFFGVKDSDGIIGKSIYYIWDKFRDSSRLNWDNYGPKPSLGTILLLYIPGAWQFVGYLHDVINSHVTIGERLMDILKFLPLVVIYTLVKEGIQVPIYVLFISPFILVGHVIKGIYGIWKTNSVTFFGNSYELQTIIFYSTIASLFETITEALPQFLLQSWIYFHSQDLIPKSTYYISVGFSMVNMMKAIVIFILTRKELKFSTIRLANGIATDDDIYDWEDGTLKMKLDHKEENCVIQMVQYYPNSNIHQLNMAWSFLTDDGVKEIVKYLQQLKSLDVSETKITDNGIICIAKNCLQLEHLNLCNTKLTDKGLKVIAENCLQLKSLIINDTSVTDEGLIAIAENCLDMEYIYVCENITESSVSLLLSNCKQLRKLKLPFYTLSGDVRDKYRWHYPYTYIC